MRIASFMLLVLGLATNAFSQQSVTSTNEDTERAAIESSVEDYVAAYNGRDAAKLSQLWSEKAVYLQPETGDKFVGREAIHKMFTDLFAGAEPMHLSVTVDEIRFVTEDVAIETGTARLVHGAGNVSRTNYSAIHIHQNDRWLLDSVMDTEVELEPSDTGPLAELEWMIGDWIDASEDSTVETVCKWTKNKSFMTRTFKVSATGIDELEGTQVIGWDPINRSLRSWVFDSDGGFSEGSWTKKGESWVVESSGFTAEGKPVRSIQVYAKVGADSFHWQSFGRRVGAERLPDIAEVKVVRKP